MCNQGMGVEYRSGGTVEQGGPVGFGGEDDGTSLIYIYIYMRFSLPLLRGLGMAGPSHCLSSLFHL